ncbi:MAG: ribosome silencing factor [Acholeplasmataceae bacterium]|jgi:ribosome-associated protein|nr:ribosome silencing factor [Acholeplasmataceae bacterium]
MLEKTLNVVEKVKLEDLKVFDLENDNPFFRYVIIGTSKTGRQGDALVGYLKEDLKDNYEIRGIEGKKTGWLLIDLGDIIIHVFDKEMREYYSFDDRFIGKKVIK